MAEPTGQAGGHNSKSFKAILTPATITNPAKVLAGLTDYRNTTIIFVDKNRKGVYIIYCALKG
jgi:hypothetical protein